jgi:hypothetical protein
MDAFCKGTGILIHELQYICMKRNAANWTPLLIKESKFGNGKNFDFGFGPF